MRLRGENGVRLSNVSEIIGTTFSVIRFVFYFHIVSSYTYGTTRVYSGIRITHER